MLVQNPAKRKILQRIFDRRICLQGHPFPQAVDIDSRHTGHFVGLVGLFGDDRSQRHHLVPAQTAASAGGIPLRSPETVVLLAHAAHEILGRNRPIKFISIGDKDRKELQAVGPDLPGELRVGQRPHQLRRIGIELAGQPRSEKSAGTGIVERNAHGRLHPQFEHPGDFDDVHSRFQYVVPRFEGALQLQTAGIPVKSPVMVRTGTQRVEQPRVVRAGAYIKVAPLPDGISEKLKDENQSHRCPDCNRSNKHDKQSFFRRHSLHSLTLPAPPSETHPGSLFGIRLSKNSDKIADSSFFLCKDTKNSYFCAGVSLIRPAPTDSPR